jgi:hypothetical protein
MRWWPIALVALPLAGCLGGRSSGPAIVAPPVVRPTGAAGCLADWNDRANAAVRAAATPPHGPYLLYGHAPAVSPHGGFQAFVALSVVIGAPGNDPPPRCYVYFRFPHGYRGGPALVSYPEIRPAAGVYGDPGMTMGNDTDVGGRVYRQDAGGRLHATGRSRRA